MDDSSYRSFLIRLWREGGVADAPWRGEVEHIQSGVVVAVFSIEEALSLIRQTAVGDEAGAEVSDRTNSQGGNA
ncbi:MAG TPA: hypothetical protein VFU22_20930 [Roseiflexaceae bacterium]|nr:hypothetical protein [Roseiflexaceae bacterium]